MPPRGAPVFRLALAAAVLVALPATAQAGRPDTPGSRELPPLFAQGEVVETLASPSGDFLIHFSRKGPNAVVAADQDQSGVPDYVELVARTYDAVLAFYRDELGFLAPLSDVIVPDDNGGDGRFDVYLVDFGGRADGSFRQEACLAEDPVRCAGYMVQENDFAGYPYPTVETGVRILASHELFHAVQAAYTAAHGAVLGEATATWATEKFDPALDDLEYQVGGYLDRPERSLGQEPTGPVDAASYGSALFFVFLDERFDSALVRELWEAVAGQEQPAWLDALDPLLASRGGSFAEAFAEFARWNLYTGPRADPAKSYAGGAGYPLVAVVPATAPYSDDLVRLFYASARYYGVAPAGRAQITAALVPQDGDAATLEGVRLYLAVRRGTIVADPVELPVAGQPVAVDAAGADEVIALLVNTATAGESRRPGLCLGSPEEVDACRVKLGGGAPLDGGPGEDAGGGPDAGAPDLVGVDAGGGPDQDGGDEGGGDGGGCQLAAGAVASSAAGIAAGPGPAAALLLLLVLGLVARVQRRRAAACAGPCPGRQARRS